MHVVVNFLFQLIFIFPLFLGMVMYANELKTKEIQKLNCNMYRTVKVLKIVKITVIPKTAFSL